MFLRSGIEGAVAPNNAIFATMVSTKSRSDLFGQMHSSYAALTLCTLSLLYYKGIEFSSFLQQFQSYVIPIAKTYGSVKKVIYYIARIFYGAKVLGSPETLVSTSNKTSRTRHNG